MRKLLRLHLEKIGSKLTELSKDQSEYLRNTNRKGHTRIPTTGIELGGKMESLNFPRWPRIQLSPTKMSQTRIFL